MVSACARAIDLAVDAVEIADLVGIQIHADRDARAAAAEDRIDEFILAINSPVV